MNLINGNVYAHHRGWQELKWILIFQAIFCSWNASSAQKVLTPSAISIFDVSTPNRNINRTAINSVLDQVGNRPIGVISINGPSRSGKSFLLSYFVRHLESESLTGTGNVEGALGLGGFEWRGGQEGVTAGIHLWSKPYFVKSENGDEIAVLLLDTQGLFDKKTTYRQNAIIFTISSLLSSVFMYNQKDVVLEDTLQHISCFSNLADNIAKKVNGGKSGGALGLPGNLMFLLRDLDMAEYEHGLHTIKAKPKGSLNNYILDLSLSKSKSKEVSSASSQTPVNPEENRRVRQKLQKFYSTISAFLLPHPGSHFLKNTDKLTPSNEFQKQALSLVTSVISLKTTTASKTEFSKVMDNIETVSKNSATFFLDAQSMDEMKSINEHGNALNKARLVFEAHLNSFLNQHPTGASHSDLLRAAEDGLQIAKNEFQHLEEYSPELEDKFLEERDSTFEIVLNNAVVLNARNREAAEAEEKEIQRRKEAAEAEEKEIKRRKELSKSNLDTLGRFLTYGGSAVAAVGAALPGPGTVAALFGGFAAARGAVIRDLGDA